MRYPIVAFIGKARSGKDTAAAMLCSKYNGVALAFADPIKRFFRDLASSDIGWALTDEHLWGSKKQELVSRPREPLMVELVAAFIRAIRGSWQRPDAIDHELLGDMLWHWYCRMPETTTPRHLMQSFGTEGVRAFNPRFWSQLGFENADKLLNGGYSYTPQEGLVFVPDSTQSYNLVCLTDCRFRNEALPLIAMNGRLFRIQRPSLESKLSATEQQHASETEQESIPEEWLDGTIVNSGSLEDFQSRVWDAFRDLPISTPSAYLDDALGLTARGTANS